MTTEEFTRSGICFDDVAIDTIGHRLLVGRVE